MTPLNDEHGYVMRRVLGRPFEQMVKEYGSDIAVTCLVAVAAIECAARHVDIDDAIAKFREIYSMAKELRSLPIWPKELERTGKRNMSLYAVELDGSVTFFVTAEDQLGAIALLKDGGYLDSESCVDCSPVPEARAKQRWLTDGCDSVNLWETHISSAEPTIQSCSEWP